MMKLSTLAIIGIQMGVILTSATGAENRMTPQMRTFYARLTPEAKKQFLELDTYHRQAAMRVYTQYCRGLTDCKGLREGSVLRQYEEQQRVEKLNNK